MKLDFEKLGAFYLGRRFEPDTGVTDETILYDAKDLTTHAMCVGMTGSGKTGLCLSLLEEAAIDGIPAICIDPKGDLGNLLLTFPSLEASAFEPWIDPGDASRRGQTAAERAVDVAALWKDGLASWGQDGARIQRLRDAVDFAIYTPGSDAGRQISVMGSLKPPKNYDGDTDRITAAVSGLLSMIGVDADPVQSREHVFLSNVVHHAWSRGEALELGGLVRAVMDPPIARVGVLDLDTFFPKKDRQALAMRLNGLLASPGFGAWMQGEPLSAQRLLWTPEGKPRVSILNIAHLSDEERMFFVTLLLNEVVSWMRTQPGTSSLRALLYMDEVFGFLPPVAAPPSKKLFLTLLKQARAYGLGLVLATQNPIDLDYKALSNCGTWLLGRLQTERDVARVMDGLAGAAQAAGQTFDASALKSTLAGLKSRVFLMNNVHESAPVLFHTRWAMSYLRGPLTSAQIRTLEGDAGDDGAKGATAGPTATAATASATVAAATAAAATAAAATSTGATSTGATSTGGATASADPIQARPVIEAEIDEFFVGDPVGDFSYEPAFLATVRLHYKRARPPVDEWQTATLLTRIEDASPAALWDAAEFVDDTLAVNGQPETPKEWGELPRGALTKSRLRSVQSKLKSHLYATKRMTVYRCKALKVEGRAGETQDEFVARVRHAAREKRDLEIEKVKAKFEKKHDALMRKVRRAEDKLAREKAQVKDKQIDTALSVGTTVLGAIFGRRTTIAGHASRAATAARRGSRAMKEQRDVERAEASLAELQAEVEELDEELTWALTEVKADASELPEVDEIEVAPKKSDIEVVRFALAWVPV